MTQSQIKALLDDILHISELIGGMNAQRVYKMYGPLDAVVEHGLRESLYEKKQKLLETVTENWQPIITIDNVDLLANQVDVWSKKHGRIVDVTYGKETYGNRVGIVHQAYYDCNGPVFEIVTDATHWMVVKGPIEGVKG
jgi:hypothetical protein